MCAGKLLNLIKKCLNREKNQHQSQPQCQQGAGGGTPHSHGHGYPPSPTRAATGSRKGGGGGGVLGVSGPGGKRTKPCPCVAAGAGVGAPGGYSALPTETAGKPATSASYPPVMDQLKWVGCFKAPNHHHQHHQQQQQPQPQEGGCHPHPHQRGPSAQYPTPSAAVAPGVSGPGIPVPNSNVAYTQVQRQLDRQLALTRERHILQHGAQTDMELNLPPAIQRSDDGEEGFRAAQRVLLCPKAKGGESIRPPPNRTILQGESPPPYRSNSVGGLEGPGDRRRRRRRRRPAAGGEPGPRSSPAATACPVGWAAAPRRPRTVATTRTARATTRPTPSPPPPTLSSSATL